MVQSDYLDYTQHKQYNIIRRNNISYNKDVGIYIEFSIMNVFEENNLIKNKVSVWIAWYEATIDFSYLKDFPFRPCHNTWHANYWSDWKFHAPRPIRAFLELDIWYLIEIYFIPPFLAMILIFILQWSHININAIFTLEHHLEKEKR